MIFFGKFHLFFSVFSLQKQTFSVRKALHLVGNRNVESQKTGRWNKKYSKLRQISWKMWARIFLA